MAKPTINSESVAQDQIRAFVERIMRMREEAKAIKDDIREIYAEAKGNGFDKTVLGQIVSHVEKRQKDPDTLAERSALFELYLEAFDSGSSHARTRTREIIDDFGTVAGFEPHDAFDPETGEVLDQSTAARTDVPRRDGLAGPVQNQDGDSQAPQNDPAGGTVEVSAGVESAGVGRVERPVASPRSNGSQAGTQAPPVDTHSAAPATTPPGAIAADAEEQTHGSDAGSSAINIEGLARPTAADNARSLRPWCLHADDLSKCAGQGHRHCHACEKAHAQSEAA